MKEIRVLCLFVFILALKAWPVAALGPDELLPDPTLEARARVLSRELRCLVCQNESIDDSNAELARDLRRLVRHRLTAGDSDSEVLAYIHDRYGDFVLMRPPLTPRTALLWFGPFALLAGLSAGGVFYIRRRSLRPPPPIPPLTEAEQERLRQLESEA